ncbi:MAG TPA: hypothetical protein VK400_01345 [Pyrinomonadaceae bacterium]|nr:hypothetical protein [Pyrinomonadaceae bacterium]
MNNALEEKKRLMRDYWLDLLSDNQIELLETEWFASDENAELLEIARTDLIEDYLTDSLSRAELDRFKSRFLINNLEEVAIAKSYFELSGERRRQQTPQKQAVKTGFFETLSENWRSFVKIPQIAFAAAALLVGGLALYIGFYNIERQQPINVARNETPEPGSADGNQNAINPVSPQNQSNQREANTSSETKPDNNQDFAEDTSKPSTGITVARNKTTVEKAPENAAPRRAAPQVLFLTNFRGSVKTLKLSADRNRNFSLKLDMPGIAQAYKSYEIRIYDANNNLVVQQKLNDNLSLKKSGEKIEIRNLDKNKFKKNNTYKTYLVAYDEENNVEELSLYDSFKVN